MPRRMLIAGNWKMNKTISEAEAFAKRLKSSLGKQLHCDLLIFPPFFAVPFVARVLKGTSVMIGAQDLFWEGRGAFTGEISCEMIRDAGGSYVLVGHSERRHILGEVNEVVARKLQAALSSGLKPVFCVGELLAEREAGETEAVVKRQLESALSGLSAEEMERVVIAYEPVWAIGTGKTATPEDAEQMHAYIRRYVEGSFGREMAEELIVQYGGSVKPENARSLLEKEQVDGLLVGGASLDVDSLLGIAAAAGIG